MTSSAFADMIIGSNGAGWQPWTLGSLNEDGKPYWDRVSGDGSKKDIGYCLTGTGNCVLDNYPGAVAFWGNSTGQADPSFYFSSTTDSPHNFTLELELAGYHDANVFGWYAYDPISGQMLEKHIIFDGPDSPEKSVDLLIPENYGFYLYVGNTNKTYYTQSELNTDDKGYQHFAIFRDDNVLWIGMEDLSFNNADWDYNDMIVRDPIATPEPSSVLLFSAGLVGIRLIRKKVKKEEPS
jgi:hypothetical protein